MKIEVIDDEIVIFGAEPPAKMESFLAIKLLTLSTSEGSFCLNLGLSFIYGDNSLPKGGTTVVWDSF